VAWSADGSRIAFTGSKGAKRGIFTVRADGTGLHYVVGTKGGSNPVFSADGTKIAFQREHLGKGIFLGTTPWVVRASGGRPRRLAEWRSEVEYVPASFSPDGLALAVTKEKFGSDDSRALLLSLNGDRVRVLARQASEPVFSPDGSQIAFVRHSTSRREKVPIRHSDLYVMSSDGSTTRALTRTRWIAESHPSWDPSGQRVAFNAFRISKEPIEALFDALLPFGNSIVNVNADGTCRQRLLSLNAALFGAVWEPGTGREAGRILC
jgi:TolB protein